jgi:hypothetical protein
MAACVRIRRLLFDQNMERHIRAESLANYIKTHLHTVLALLGLVHKRLTR